MLRPQGRRFGAAALRCVARVAAAAPDWGVIFFGYDWFAAYSAAAAASVAWDVLIPHYKVCSRPLSRFRASPPTLPRPVRPGGPQLGPALCARAGGLECFTSAGLGLDARVWGV
jgi:hypothetical protein